MIHSMFFHDVIIPVVSLLSFSFAMYCTYRIRNLERRITNSEANFIFIKEMLVEIDSKLIKLDIENHIKEKLNQATSEGVELDEKEIIDYVKDLLDRHKKFSSKN